VTATYTKVPWTSRCQAIFITD